MEKSNLVIFDDFGKIRKSTNWLLIGFIALSIIGIFVLIWYNWDRFNTHIQDKPKVINAGFSATITFDEKKSNLQLAIQSEQKQEFSMRILNSLKQEVWKYTIIENKQQFDFKLLEPGHYTCIVSGDKNTVVQTFEKK